MQVFIDPIPTGVFINPFPFSIFYFLVTISSNLFEMSEHYFTSYVNKNSESFSIFFFRIKKVFYVFFFHLSNLKSYFSRQQKGYCKKHMYINGALQIYT